MSCQRAREIDLAAFAADPRARDWRAFRQHYPTCADCAAAVAEWSKLAALLRDAPAQELAPASRAHPSPDALLRFGTAPAQLEGSLRAQITQHVECCAPCRNELAVLRDFDLAALPASVRPAAEKGRGLLATLSGWLEPLLGGALPAPALAVLALVVLALPVAWFLARGGARNARTEVAQQAPPSAIAPGPDVEPETLHPPPVEVARRESDRPQPAPEIPTRSAPGEMSGERPGEEPSEGRPAPDRIAEHAPRAPSQDPTPRPEPEPLADGGTLQIAALLPDAAPQYVPMPDLVGGSLESIRASSLIRAAGDDLPAIRALAPPHVGASATRSPVLYWHLSAESPVAVEVVLADSDAIEPLLELQHEGPVAAGLQRIDLASRGIELEVGHSYEWSVSLVRDPQQRGLDVSTHGAFVVAPPTPTLAERLDQASLGERAHLLAEAGYWYDAFATLSRWLESEPDAPRLRAHRDALLTQAELPGIE